MRRHLESSLKTSIFPKMSILEILELSWNPFFTISHTKLNALLTRRTSIPAQREGSRRGLAEQRKALPSWRASRLKGAMVASR